MKSILKKTALKGLLLAAIGLSGINNHVNAQMWTGAVTKDLSQKEGDVSVGVPSPTSNVLNPDNIKLLLQYDPGTVKINNPNSTRSNFGHWQSGDFGTHKNDDNWFEAGKYAPYFGNGDQYGTRYGWNKYGFSMALGEQINNINHAYIDWWTSNSDGGTENNLYFRSRKAVGGFNDVMTLLFGGNVGINNTTPDYKLHLKFEAVPIGPLSGGNPTGAMIENTNPASGFPSLVGTYSNELALKTAYGQSRIGMGDDAAMFVGSKEVIGSATGNLHLTTGNNNVRMSIQDANGFVGIGTSSPTQKLHINYGSVVMDKWIFDTRYWVNGDYLNIAPQDAGGNWDFTKSISVEKATGKFKVSQLAGAGSRMVMVDANGWLSSQPLQTLSFNTATRDLTISGGNTVNIPNVGDNLGNHTATADINMSLHNVNNAFDISASHNITSSLGNIEAITGSLKGAGLTVSGSGSFGNSLSVSATLNVAGNTTVGNTSTTSDLTVFGDILPGTDNVFFLGSSLKRFNEIFCTNSSINTSDINFKKDIKNLNYGIKDLMKINPITFRWKENENGTRLGFSAQELQKVLPEVVVDNNGKLGVRYTEIIPVLVNAIKEQEAVIENQQKLIEELMVKMDAAKSGALPPSGSNAKAIPSSRLDQNIPNPFGKTTVINYYLTDDAVNAMLLVTDLNGRQLKRIDIKGVGNGKVELNGNDLLPGTYLYTLVANDNIVDTKRMVIVGE